MRYRLERLPIQFPAPTAALAGGIDSSADELMSVLTRRAARQEDVRVDVDELQVVRVTPRRISLRWPGSAGPRPVASALLGELRRWTGLGEKDFVHARHESPESLGRRIDRALEERGEAWKGCFLRLEDGHVRAILPRAYDPLDHLEAARAFCDECETWRGQGVDLRIDSCEELCGELFLSACAPSLAAEVREGDWLYAGIALANSECTTSALEVKPRIYRAVCANGAVAQEAEAEGFAVEKLSEPLISNAPASTAPQASARAEFRRRLAGAFELSFSSERVEREASVDRVAAASPLVSPFEHLQHLVARGLLRDEDRDTAQRLFQEGHEASVYGLANAVTAAAHGQRDEDLRRVFALETLGAEIARGEHGPPVGAPVWV